MVISVGNTGYLDGLAKTGEKTLKEVKDIEVPRGMTDVHVKAIRLAKYSMTLKDETKSIDGQSDPLGLISSLSKVNGLLAVIASFHQEIVAKTSELGIESIPLDL